MKPYHETAHGVLYHGDCLAVMKQLPDNSIDSCITSPPYWGLRDYGVTGQYGLEKTPEEYVDNMVKLFNEVSRVLKDDGLLWLNLGDSYAGSGCGTNDYRTEKSRSINKSDKMYSKTPPQQKMTGLKPKDLVGIPWRVAFALQADGWYLRQDIIWHKPNPMPESVTDRCTKSHEYIFLMSKSAKYYYDADAIKEEGTAPDRYNSRLRDTNIKQAREGAGVKAGIINYNTLEAHRQKYIAGGCMRNKRSVWTVTTKPYKEAHFATYPPDLILPCVLASKPNAVILDPFFGSGTTGVVAIQNQRRYVGIELNEKYCEIAAKRIDSELDQTDIFREEE